MFEGLPSFEAKDFWESELKRYVDSNAHSFGDNGGIWEYFKHCLQTQNRFFFQNPLIPIIVNRFEKNAITINSGTQLYRARIDNEREYEKQCWTARDLIDIQKSELSEEEKSKPSLASAIKEYWIRESERILNSPEYQEFQSRKEKGFEGFDAQGSGAPPYKLVSAGRCNPEHVSFLYAAGDKHTAIAEVRPFIRDAISVASLKVTKDLKLVDFYYEYDKTGAIIINDYFYHQLRSEFAMVNKGEKEEYLTTQFLSLLAENSGFDGIRFRSSLVSKGTNYVIFNNSNCEVISSKMYIIPEVQYTFLPIIDEE